MREREKKRKIQKDGANKCKEKKRGNKWKRIRRMRDFFCKSEVE